MKHTLVIVLLLLIATTGGAQYIPLMREGKSALYLDLDAVWRYNLYEHSRWGVGLKYTHGDSLTLVANAGYGLADNQWKGAVGGSLVLPASHRDGTLYGMLSRDYTPAGSRRMQAWKLTDIGSLSSFMDRRMIDQLSLLAGYRWRTSQWRYSVEARLFASQRLFDNERMLYLKEGTPLYREQGVELRTQAASASGFSLELLCASVCPGPRPVVQALAQWERQYATGPLALDLYLQGGMVPPGVPYPYLFDLGGTWGAPFHFRKSLLTARPNEFCASLFSFVSVQWGWHDALFEWWNSLLQIGTYPRPFVGVDAAWGHLWGQSPEGRLTWEGLELQSPLYGLAEAVVGVEGLLRWGVVDWGAAIAYRLVPPVAAYRYSDPHDNLALLITAKLIF